MLTDDRIERGYFFDRSSRSTVQWCLGNFSAKPTTLVLLFFFLLFDNIIAFCICNFSFYLHRSAGIFVRCVFRLKCTRRRDPTQSPFSRVVLFVWKQEKKKHTSFLSNRILLACYQLIRNNTGICSGTRIPIHFHPRSVFVSVY